MRQRDSETTVQSKILFGQRVPASGSGLAARPSAASHAGAHAAARVDRGWRELSSAAWCSEMMPAEQRLALDDVAGKVTAAIRRTVIEPGEVTVATLERIRVDTYTPDVAEHAIAQLVDLVEILDRKLASDTQAIARLGNTLDSRCAWVRCPSATSGRGAHRSNGSTVI